jgi:hypothetical protein
MHPELTEHSDECAITRMRQASQIDAAVHAEREACAKVAEEQGRMSEIITSSRVIALFIAQGIRARKST